MLSLPKNPISTKLNLHMPVKTITISSPDVPGSDIMLWISWDAGMHMRVPELEVPDISSADAIIEQRKAVTVTGWSRMAASYILVTDVCWEDPAEIEQWVSEIGWALGAGYMYRWYDVPGSRHDHLWGNVRYTVMGDDLSRGDASDWLADLAEKHGCWQWEINAAYHKQNGQSALFWPEWYRCDVSLDEDGGRSSQFPGWDGHHPWLRAIADVPGYESHYYYCPTYRGRGQNKRMKKENWACYPKGMKWQARGKGGL